MDYIYHGGNNKTCHSSGNTYADNIAQSSAGIISDYLEGINKRKISPIVLADFGTDDDRVALRTYKLVLDTLSQRSLKKQMIVVLNDISANSMSLISKHVKESGIQGEDGVTVLLSAKDFYSSCSPSSYIDVSMTHLTTVYVKSLTIENELFPQCINVTETERMMFKEQMKDNWRIFLKTRSQELKQGGMLIVTLTLDHANLTKILQKMSNMWRDLYTTGVITQFEFKKGTVGICCPTEEDIVSPFVNKIYSGLKVVNFLPIPLGGWWTRVDTQGQPPCTAAVFAEKLTAYLQSYTRCFIEAAFSESEKRSNSEKEEIVDLFYEKTQAALEKLGFIPDHDTFCMVLLQKIE